MLHICGSGMGVGGFLGGGIDGDCMVLVILLGLGLGELVLFPEHWCRLRAWGGFRWIVAGHDLVMGGFWLDA